MKPARAKKQPGEKKRNKKKQALCESVTALTHFNFLERLFFVFFFQNKKKCCGTKGKKKDRNRDSPLLERCQAFRTCCTPLDKVKKNLRRSTVSCLIPVSRLILKLLGRERALFIQASEKAPPRWEEFPRAMFPDDPPFASGFTVKRAGFSE